MPPKKLLPLLLIIIVAIIIAGIYMFNWFKKSGSDYQKVTLQEIDANPDKYDGKRIEYTGAWTSAFEVSNLDGKIWLGGKDEIFNPIIKTLPDVAGKRMGKVRVFGTLGTKLKHYGHLGQMPYQLTADKIELIENYKILEIRDFSCPGMTGFSFKYPVFEGWEVKKIERTLEIDECHLYLDYPNTIDFEVAPQISIQKISRPGYPAPGNSIPEYPPKLNLKNPQGIPYQGDVINSSAGKPVTDAVHFVSFYTSDFAVKISQNFFDISNKHGFNDNQFWKTVIESFRMVK